MDSLLAEKFNKCENQFVEGNGLDERFVFAEGGLLDEVASN